MAEFFYADRLFSALEREEPAPGMLMLAAPGMLSSEFARTVVLIIEHNLEHTLGVVLNRRSEVAVANVLPEWLDYVAKPQALYLGGPLGPQAAIGVGVTTSGTVIEDHLEFTRLANRLVHVDLRTDPTMLDGLLEGVRIFAGYAEWAPGQLDDEIERGDWYVAPALPSDVIAPAGTALYSDIMRRQPMPLPLFSTFPADIDDN